MAEAHPVYMRPGDATIAMYHIPHSGSRNENGRSARKSPIFALVNKKDIQTMKWMAIQTTQIDIGMEAFMISPMGMHNTKDPNSPCLTCITNGMECRKS